MMFALYHRFRRERRGAIMLIFALSLVPLMLLVGFSIDYSFFAQARAQFSLAGDSAASYAIRVATATYALDSQAGKDVATATRNAEIAGNAAGDQWFSSQIATLPRAYVSGGTPVTSVTPVPGASSTPTGFTASVQYQGTYPPFFDLIWSSPSHLKNSGYTWYVTGTAQAQSSYTYSEILVLMDTSGSMLIGANPSDILTLNDNTVCVPVGDVSWTTDVEIRPSQQYGGGSGYYPAGNGALTGGSTISSLYNDDTSAADNDFIDFSGTHITGYNNPTSGSGTAAQTNINGTCSKGYNNDTTTATTPFTMTPCAFACHTTTNTFTIAADTAAGSNGYYQGAGTYTEDFYGYARSLRPKVTLRIDSVFSAAETVIKAMTQSEQVTGQYAVGVYQFNDDIAPIAPAAVNNNAPAEATTDLGTALQEVEADDWTITPTETAVPKLAAQTTGQGIAPGNCSVTNVCENYDYTSFPKAMQEWSPNFTSVTSPTPVSKLTAAGTGNSVNSPLKSLIIITDGLEDSTPYTNNVVNRLMGELTGIYAEANDVESGATTQQAWCAPLKDLGFTIYILYVQYYPIPNQTFYEPYNANPSDAYVHQDFPEGSINSLPSASGFLPHYYPDGTDGAIENWTQGNNTGNDYENGNPNATPANNNSKVENDPDPIGMTQSPDEQAMEACAGPPGGTSNISKYFFSATNSNSINNAMVSILQSALNTTTRITN